MSATKGEPDLSVLNDIGTWRDPNRCVEVLIAGVNFLYSCLAQLQGREHLSARIRALGDLRNQLAERGDLAPDAEVHDDKDTATFVRELDQLGTIGFSLWHLRLFMDSPAFRKEFKELAQVGQPGNPTGDALRLRGQGFLFFAAGFLAREGFGIEFITPGARVGQRRPDFFALRDGNRFPCEATSRHPKVLRSRTVREFWSRILDVLHAKRGQFPLPLYQRGVLLIDCTPIFDLVSLEDLPIGGSLSFMPPMDETAPPSGTVPMLRYDESEFSQGLRACEAEMARCGIRTLMLWNRVCAVRGSRVERKIEHRILGSMRGVKFWAYFPNAVAFPGPDVEVIW